MVNFSPLVILYSKIVNRDPSKLKHSRKAKRFGKFSFSFRIFYNISFRILRSIVTFRSASGSENSLTATKSPSFRLAIVTESSSDKVKRFVRLPYGDECCILIFPPALTLDCIACGINLSRFCLASSGSLPSDCRRIGGASSSSAARTLFFNLFKLLSDATRRGFTSIDRFRESQESLLELRVARIEYLSFLNSCRVLISLLHDIKREVNLISCVRSSSCTLAISGY